MALAVVRWIVWWGIVVRVVRVVIIRLIRRMIMWTVVVIVHVSLSVAVVLIPWWRVVSIVAMTIVIRMMGGR